MKDMTNNKKPNAATSALDTATAKKIAEHYCHAKAKHPYFADIAAEADELAVGGIVEAGRNRERCNSSAMREALEKLKEAYFENNDGFARIDCSIVPDFEGLIDAALAAPARNCDKYANRYWLDEFEKQMGKTPSKTADEQDEYMKENWFLFYHWLSNPATEKEGGAK